MWSCILLVLWIFSYVNLWITCFMYELLFESVVWISCLVNIYFVWRKLQLFPCRLSNVSVIRWLARTSGSVSIARRRIHPSTETAEAVGVWDLTGCHPLRRLHKMELVPTCRTLSPSLCTQKCLTVCSHWVSSHSVSSHWVSSHSVNSHPVSWCLKICFSPAWSRRVTDSNWTTLLLQRTGMLGNENVPHLCQHQILKKGKSVTRWIQWNRQTQEYVAGVSRGTRSSLGVLPRAKMIGALYVWHAGKRPALSTGRQATKLAATAAPLDWSRRENLVLYAGDPYRKWYATFTYETVAPVLLLF